MTETIMKPRWPYSVKGFRVRGRMVQPTKYVFVCHWGSYDVYVSPKKFALRWGAGNKVARHYASRKNFIDVGMPQKIQDTIHAARALRFGMR